MAPEMLDFYLLKNKIRFLSFTMYKSQFKVDQNL